MSNLKSRSAVITGSTSGIGLGIANSFAENGINLVINGFGDANEIEKIRKDLEDKYKVRVIYSAADMSKPEQIHDMVKKSEEAFGTIDILVNNAGIQHVESIETFPEEKWNAIIAINLSSAFHTIKSVVAGMKKKSWGRIINIASVHGLIASQYKTAYISAKHGIIGLTKGVALDLAEFGITCNAICPGYVDTPLVRKQIPEQSKVHNISEEEVISKILLKNHYIKEFVSVKQIAALALFLCSDEARTITGTSLPIDGGWTAS